MKIAIFGAGVAGLSAAIELVDRGHTVEIYEKRKVLPEVEYGCCKSCVGMAFGKAIIEVLQIAGASGCDHWNMH